MCGFDAAFLINLLIIAIVIGLAYAIIQLILPKFPIFTGIIGQIVFWIFWAIVAIFVLSKIVLPLLKCAGL